MVRVQTNIQVEQRKRFVASRTFRSNARLVSPPSWKDRLSRVEPTLAPALSFLTHGICHFEISVGTTTGHSHNQTLDSV